MSHAAFIHGLRKASSSAASTIIRLIYDKGYHGGNRAKNKSLSPEDRDQTRRCLLCQKPETQNHWLHECNHGPLRTLRGEVFAELNRQLLLYREKSSLHRQLGTGFKHILMSTAEPARIWTGNWSSQQIGQLTNLVNPELLQSLRPTTLSTILLPLEKILAEGALNLWQCKVLQERKLPTDTTTRPKERGDKNSHTIKSAALEDDHMQMPKAKRHRQVTTSVPNTGSSLRPVLVFPTLSN